MKRFLLTLALIALLPCAALASDGWSNPNHYTFMDGGTAISASANYSVTTEGVGVFDVGDEQGYISFQVSVTGNGTLKLQVFQSLDGVTYVPAGFAGADGVVYDGMTSAAGFDANGKTAGTRGKYFFQFDCPYAIKIKLVATETGGAATITPTILVGIR